MDVLWQWGHKPLFGDHFSSDAWWHFVYVADGVHMPSRYRVHVSGGGHIDMPNGRYIHMLDHRHITMLNYRHFDGFPGFRVLHDHRLVVNDTSFKTFNYVCVLHTFAGNHMLHFLHLLQIVGVVRL